jgi:hypothetical protein
MNKLPKILLYEQKIDYSAKLNEILNKELRSESKHLFINLAFTGKVPSIIFGLKPPQISKDRSKS